MQYSIHYVIRTQGRVEYGPSIITKIRVHQVIEYKRGGIVIYEQTLLIRLLSLKILIYYFSTRHV